MRRNAAKGSSAWVERRATPKGPQPAMANGQHYETRDDRKVVVGGGPYIENVEDENHPDGNRANAVELRYTDMPCRPVRHHRVRQFGTWRFHRSSIPKTT